MAPNELAGLEPVAPVGVQHCADNEPALAQLIQWTRAFLMSDHPELGRCGNICPFIGLGGRLDTLLFGVGAARADEPEVIWRQALATFERFEEILHPAKSGGYRAIFGWLSPVAPPRAWRLSIARNKVCGSSLLCMRA